MTEKRGAKPANGSVVAQTRFAVPRQWRSDRQGVKIYCEEMVNEIFERMAQGETLSSVCKDERMPTRMTVYRWMREYPAFLDTITLARDLYYDTLMDEVTDIADDVDGDPSRDRLRVKARIDKLALLDAQRSMAGKASSMKTVEAEKDTSGDWKVLENGERANSVSETIREFKRKHGLVKNEKAT